MISYSPSCCISPPLQSSTTPPSLMPSQDHCQQETTPSTTSSPTITSVPQSRQHHLHHSQEQQQLSGFQETIRSASMSDASSPPLPPPLMIPNSSSAYTDENSNSTNPSSSHPQQHSHYPHHPGHHHSQYYQHRHSSSSSTSSSWTLAYPPVTPPSSQQDVTLMEQSPLYDPYPSSSQQYPYPSHLRQSPITSVGTPTSTTFEAMTLTTPTTPLSTIGHHQHHHHHHHRGSTASMMSPHHQQQHQHQQQQQQPKKHLRFHVVLQALTAVTQKTEHTSLTYLNRGQSYGIQLADKLGHDGLIQSQFVITFHDPAHRKIALSYWKFWIGQQKDPQHARAVDLDSRQSIGIMNVRYPSFDRIAFDWHGRHGAKLFVRFHCLSTDFSRIKGVKGIPLRACMSSQISSANDPLLLRHYAGTFLPNDKDQPDVDYLEQSFCKVKLFRDKGAERKNKDDAKQLAKQFEKMMHDGDPRQHPMWLMYNESVPQSVFNETPTSPTLESFDQAMMFAPGSNLTTATTPNLVQSRAKNTSKLPPTLPTLSYHQHSSQHYHQHHYHPYAKRPASSLSPSSNNQSSPTTITATIPTQLYTGGNSYDSLLPSTNATSPTITSASPPPLPSFTSNNDVSSIQQQQQHQQQVYQYPQQAYHYHQQNQHHQDRFSPIPSTDSSILTGWRRSS